MLYLSGNVGEKKQKKSNESAVVIELPREPFSLLTDLPRDILNLIINGNCTRLGRLLLTFVSKSMYEMVDHSKVIKSQYRWLQKATEGGSISQILWIVEYCMARRDDRTICRQTESMTSQDWSNFRSIRLQYLFHGSQDVARGRVTTDFYMLKCIYNSATRHGRVRVLYELCGANFRSLYSQEEYTVGLCEASCRGYGGVLQWHVQMCVLNNISNIWAKCKPLAKSIIEGGNLEVLQFYNNAGGSVGLKHFELAARLGLLYILKWMIGKAVTIEITHIHRILGAAARGGHLDCVQYVLPLIQDSLITNDTILKACKGGNANILECILARDAYPFRPLYGDSFVRKAIGKALWSKSTGAIQWLKETWFDRIDQDMIEEHVRILCAHRRYDMLAWLLNDGYTWEENGLWFDDDWPDYNWIGRDLKDFIPHLAKLLEIGFIWPAEYGMVRLAEWHALDIMKWARSEGLAWGTFHLCVICYKGKQQEMLEWLLSPDGGYTPSKEEFAKLMELRKRPFATKMPDAWYELLENVSLKV